MTRVLVTGGAGFIGSHLVDRLVQEGHDVVVVDINDQPRHRNPSTLYIRGDIRDFDLKRLIAKRQVQTVFHLAAQVSVRQSVCDPMTDGSINVLGSMRVFSAAAAAGVQRLIFSSTAAVYGNPENLPIAEDHPLLPISPYGFSKMVAEHYLRIFADTSSRLRFVILRYANVYGPRQTAHGEAGVVAIWCDQLKRGDELKIYGDGSKTRDYVFVGDVVAANLAAMTRGDNNIFNIGSGKPTSDSILFTAVTAAFGSWIQPQYVDDRAGDVPHSCFDVTKAQELLGWQANVPLLDGLAQTVAYYHKD